MLTPRSQSQAVRWAAGFENFGIRYMEVNIRCFKARMPQEFLDIEDISTGFQRMRSKAMTKGMNSAGRRNVCTAQVFAESNFNPGFTQMSFFSVSREQIPFRRRGPVPLPVVSQRVQSALGQNCIAVFSSL